MQTRASIISDMNKLSLERRARILACLCEGNSIRATCRLLDCSKGAVIKLLEDVGAACRKFHDEHVQGVQAQRVQCDEVWSFCYAKEKNVPADVKGHFGYGDTWTWTGIEAQTKLIIAWHVGRRDAGAARTFIADLASRITNRIQLTTDGYRAYLDAIDEAWATEVDYAMLVKLYGAEPTSKPETRYSPAQCVGTRRDAISGNPDPAHVSTSFVERHNLTIRMSNRRFTRLTNAFSKKLENHKHMLAIFFVYYNFARIHQTLRVTPAMEAGISEHVWTLEEIAALADEDSK
jgi:IS1 family transposase